MDVRFIFTSFDVFVLKNLEVLENLILDVFDLFYVLMSSVFIIHIHNAFKVAHTFGGIGSFFLTK